MREAASSSAMKRSRMRSSTMGGPVRTLVASMQAASGSSTATTMETDPAADALVLNTSSPQPVGSDPVRKDRRNEIPTWLRRSVHSSGRPAPIAVDEPHTGVLEEPAELAGLLRRHRRHQMPNPGPVRAVPIDALVRPLEQAAGARSPRGATTAHGPGRRPARPRMTRIGTGRTAASPGQPASARAHDVRSSSRASSCFRAFACSSVGTLGCVPLSLMSPHVTRTNPSPFGPGRRRTSDHGR